MGTIRRAWYGDLYLKDACYGRQQLGLGLINEGVIELHRSPRGNFNIVGRESNGARAFHVTVKPPVPSRMYVAQPAGLALLIAVVIGLFAIGVARRHRTLRGFLAWPEGVVREDGTLEPIDGGAPIPLGCACREKPGKRILFVARKGAAVGPYREHGRGGIADHVELSRDEGTRQATRLGIAGIATALVALGIAVVAFFLAAT